VVSRPPSYEDLIARRREALASEAPFLFGHAAAYKVEATYSSGSRVRLGDGSLRWVKFEGGKLVGLPSGASLLEKASAVLRGQKVDPSLLEEAESRPDHVVLAEADAALQADPAPFLTENPALVRTATGTSPLSEEADPFAYLSLGVSSAVEERAMPALRSATERKLAEVAELYRSFVAIPESQRIKTPALRAPLQALPVALAEIVRTGRLRLGCTESVHSLVGYRQRLAARAHLYSPLCRAQRIPS